PEVATTAPGKPAETAIATAATDDAKSGSVKADAEQRFTIETETSTIVFSNRGAVVEHWILKEYKTADGHPLELVNQAAFDKAGRPFALQIRGQKPPVA